MHTSKVLLQGSSLTMKTHSPKSGDEQVLHTMDVIDGALEAGMLVQGMRVIDAHKHRGPACWLPAAARGC